MNYIELDSALYTKLINAGYKYIKSCGQIPPEQVGQSADEMCTHFEQIPLKEAPPIDSLKEGEYYDDITSLESTDMVNGSENFYFWGNKEYIQDVC